MTDFTDEDVRRGAEAAFFYDMIGGHHNGLFTWDSIPEEGRENYRTMMRHVLAAVLPDIAKRVCAEALRNAAHEIEFLSIPPKDLIGDEAVGEAIGLLRASNVLRARADGMEKP